MGIRFIVRRDNPRCKSRSLLRSGVGVRRSGVLIGRTAGRGERVSVRSWASDTESAVEGGVGSGVGSGKEPGRREGVREGVGGTRIVTCGIGVMSFDGGIADVVCVVGAGWI